MKIERTKNAARNTLFGIINKVITLFIPFIVRTVFIKKLGMEYLGLNSLFTSVLSILNIAELGIGSAIVFDMYGAISNNDIDLLSALYNFYRKAYKYIGIAVAILGISVSPFLPHLIKGNVPEGINLYILYSIHLLNTLLGYFLFSYRASVITAHQRNDILSNLSTVCSLVTYTVQLILLFAGKGYYHYISVTVFGALLSNFLLLIVSKRMYPDINPAGIISDEQKSKIKGRIKALFLYSIGGLVLSSADSIVISAFLGLKELAKYNNYYYIVQTLFGFLAVYYSGLTAGIGNSIASESVEKNKKDYDKLEFIQKWVIGWFSACLLCLYQPFITLWLGESMLYPFGVVVCFVAYFYFWKMMEITNVYKNAAGLWKYDQYRQIFAPLFNIILNIVLVKKIGIYGVILSTVLSIILIILPWSTFTLFKYYFKSGFKKYMFGYLVDFLAASIVCFITYSLNSLITDNGIKSFIFKVLICSFIPNILYFVLFFKTKQFKESLPWVIEKVKQVISNE